MDHELKRIQNLLASFLEQPKRDMTDNGQLQFNCPMCASNNGLLHGDGKYNLEVNLKLLKFKCWVCSETDGMHGRISKLIRMFGGQAILSEYNSIISELKEAALFTFPTGEDGKTETIPNDIILPQGYKPLAPYFNNNERAMYYLRKRGITPQIIEKFKIGTIGDVEDRRLRERIILPSFDAAGDLNYWVGRSYNTSSKTFMKYVNAETPKSAIIFNEQLLDWYADITLVEGPFDHIVTPNSIPLLGKFMERNSYMYKSILHNAKVGINLFLDSDAPDDILKVARYFNNGEFRSRIYYVPYPKDNHGMKLDPSLLFQEYGPNGIIGCFKRRERIPEYLL